MSGSLELGQFEAQKPQSSPLATSSQISKILETSDSKPDKLGSHTINSQLEWKGMLSKLRPTNFKPTLFKNLNKFDGIARGGRVSNPVPGRAGPKTGLAPKIAELCRTWSAEDLRDATKPVLKLEVPMNSMRAERDWGLERVWFEQGWLILGERMELARELKAAVFGMRENYEGERNSWKLSSGLMRGG